MMFKRVRLLIEIECDKSGIHGQEEVFANAQNWNMSLMQLIYHAFFLSNFRGDRLFFLIG